MSGEDSQVDPDGNGCSHPLFLVQHFLAAEKRTMYFPSLLVNFVHKTMYSVPSSSLMLYLSH